MLSAAASASMALSGASGTANAVAETTRLDPTSCRVACSVAVSSAVDQAVEDWPNCSAASAAFSSAATPMPISLALFEGRLDVQKQSLGSVFVASFAFLKKDQQLRRLEHPAELSLGSRFNS